MRTTVAVAGAVLAVALALLVYVTHYGTAGNACEIVSGVWLVMALVVNPRLARLSQRQLVQAHLAGLATRPGVFRTLLWGAVLLGIASFLPWG